MRFDGDGAEPLAKDRARDVLRSVQYIFQNPYTSLNPRKTVGQIVEQPLAHFFKLSPRGAGRAGRGDARGRRAERRTSSPVIPTSSAAASASAWPSRARSSVEPSLLVCDEVTSALDVSVQAAIVELLRRLQAERGLSLLFITHNLALVRSIAQQVVVLHEGRVVERGPTERVLSAPSTSTRSACWTTCPS